MEKKVYEIMQKNRKVAEISETGFCKIYDESFLPYNLYLEENDDIDTLVNNVTNFYYWCATRVLTLDRKYAKEILNSIGMRQAVTDRERAQIALSYRCASLTDVFWVRQKGEEITFEEINLYNNHLKNTFIDISLRGKQYTADNHELAKDLSTNGCFPKAWKREEEGFILLKDGGEDAVERELLASRICQCFDVSQVIYQKSYFSHEKVTKSENITSLETSLASMEAFEIYAQNHDRDVKEYILSLDSHNYYMMNIIDYLVGNTDRQCFKITFLYLFYLVKSYLLYRFFRCFSLTHFFVKCRLAVCSIYIIIGVKRSIKIHKFVERNRLVIFRVHKHSPVSPMPVCIGECLRKD